MELVERAKAIILKPRETWETIRSEKVTVAELFTSYACILAVIPSVASFIGLSLIGIGVPFIGWWRQPVIHGIGHIVLSYILSLAGVLITTYIAAMVAPHFGSRRDMTAAAKAVVYSFTPVWVAGILNIFPPLGTISWILGLYSLYLLFLGLPLMMETPAEKKTGYVVVVVAVTILVMITISIMGGLFLAGARVAGMAGGL
ncbi:MAG TPA: Yip1 family protein [Syntrophorhabdaceae bacterium]|jgi:hypothetical protein